MKKLLLVRHGLSVGNKKGIIQGLSNYPLTDEGKDNVLRLVKDNLEYFSGKDKILTSPLVRCRETSDIISSYIKADSNIDDLLVEFSAGILDGLSKVEAQEKYSEYLKIWTSRGDLDLIPNATKGDELQARVLMFLEQYLNKENYNDIIVSHAGFLRCLINTVLKVARTTPVNLEHNNIHELNDVFANLKVKQHTIAKNSQVLEIETFEKKYILKKANRLIEQRDLNEQEILKYLSKYINVPEIYLMANRNNYLLKTLEYKEGSNFYGELNERMLYNTIKELYKMQEALKNYPESKNFEIIDILENLRKDIFRIKDSNMREIGLELLKDEIFQNAIKADYKSLVHDDLHRANILYNKDNVAFLDFEGLKIYPITYQLASHIAASYLLNDVDFNIKKVLDLWPIQIDYKYLLCLIKYRLYEGLVYFQERIENKEYDSSDVDLKDKYVKCLKHLK